jgi:dolichyl-phosphate beta-glucosyltransferase
MSERDGFSVIIPVYNEEDSLEKNITTLVKFLNNRGEPFEIVIGNNGSSDRTEALGMSLSKKYPGKVRIVSTDKRGVGAGIKIAILASSFERLVEMPLDLPFNLDFISKCAELLKKNDVVIGSKLLGKQRRKFWVRLLSFGYVFLTNLLLGLNFSDYSVGGKGYKKSVIMPRVRLMKNGTFYTTEFIYFAKKKGAKITEIPLDTKDLRKSRFNWPGEVRYKSFALFRFWLNERLHWPHS